MLTNCPECELPVSDKAISCPHCGYPLLKPSRTPQRSAKRRKLPNGFGRISILKQNLRKPYRAMVSKGKNEKGVPIGVILGYFETYNEAYLALAEYNKNPYDLDTAMTCADLFEKWTSGYFLELESDSSIRTVKAAWNYCSELYNMRVRDIRSRHIKGVMENGKYNGKPASENTKSRIKSLWNLMLDYAVEYEIVDKNYARDFSVDQPDVGKEHIVYTDEEMKYVWSRCEKNIVADFIAIQSYSGWRPQELLSLKISDVDIVNWTFTGGMKTAAGINRTVPIHSRIRPLVEVYYRRNIQMAGEYLFSQNGKKLTYDKFSKIFNNNKEDLHLSADHRPHDGRKHFITAAKNAGTDEYAIKRIVGHTIRDITESVYTERSVEWLRTEIEKIK